MEHADVALPPDAISAFQFNYIFFNAILNNSSILINDDYHGRSLEGPYWY